MNATFLLHFPGTIFRSWMITGRDLTGVISGSAQRALAIALACLLLASCNGGSNGNSLNFGDGGVSLDTTHADAVATFVGVLPADARGVFAVDLAALLSGGSSGEVTALLQGEGGEPIFQQQFATIGALAEVIDVTGEMSSAMLA